MHYRRFIVSQTHVAALQSDRLDVLCHGNYSNTVVTESSTSTVNADQTATALMPRPMHSTNQRIYSFKATARKQHHRLPHADFDGAAFSSSLSLPGSPWIQMPVCPFRASSSHWMKVLTVPSVCKHQMFRVVLHVW